MDPLTIARASISLARTLYRVYDSIRSFIEATRDIDDTVQSFLTQVDGLHEVVTALSAALHRPMLAKVAKENPELWRCIGDSVESCKYTVEELLLKLNGENATKLHLDQVRRQIKFEMKQDIVDRLLSAMKTHSINLQLAMEIIDVMMCVSSSELVISQHALYFEKLERMLVAIDNRLQPGATTISLASIDKYIFTVILDENTACLRRSADAVMARAITMAGLSVIGDMDPLPSQTEEPAFDYFTSRRGNGFENAFEPTTGSESGPSLGGTRGVQIQDWDQHITLLGEIREGDSVTKTQEELRPNLLKGRRESSPESADAARNREDSLKSRDDAGNTKIAIEEFASLDVLSNSAEKYIYVVERQPGGQIHGEDLEGSNFQASEESLGSHATLPEFDESSLNLVPTDEQVAEAYTIIHEKGLHKKGKPSKGLIWAAKCDHWVTIQALANVPHIDVNVQDKIFLNVKNETPLFLAADRGFIKTCATLIAAKANVDSTNRYGTTPLQIASCRNHVQICQLLLSHGANVESVVSKHSTDYASDYTPLGHAVRNCNIALCELFLNHGASIEGENWVNGTPLMIAADQDSVLTCKFLLARGADPNAVNGRLRISMSTLSYAVRKDSSEVCALLLANGARALHKNNVGNTALHYAQSDAVKETLQLYEAAERAKADTQ